MNRRAGNCPAFFRARKHAARQNRRRTFARPSTFAAKFAGSGTFAKTFAAKFAGSGTFAKTFVATFAGIFRPVRIRKDSQPRTFAKLPVFAGLRPHLRMFRHFRRIMPTFCPETSASTFASTFAAKSKKNPRQSFTGNRG